MATIVGRRLYPIFLGTPVTVADTTTILGLGPTGDATLKRRLVHPDAVNFPPVLYWQNPDRTFNVDNEVLRSPLASVERTLSTTVVFRFEEVEGDVIVTEVWTADRGKFSMPAFLFRQLYEYLVNPPDFDPVSPVFIQWSPQDRNPNTYNVELLRLAVGGGGDGAQLFDLTEFFPTGGGLDDLDEAFLNEGSGLVDQPVTFTFKIFAKV